MATVNVLKFLLLLLSALGFYSTWYLFLNNGTFDHMIHVREIGPRVLPGTTAPLKTWYTGIARLDHQLTALCLFFWQLVDGSRPDASLLCFHFAGQMSAGWGLLMMEKLRFGNRGRIIAFLVVWGVAMQNVVMNVVVPLYLVVHLSTSPTVSSTDPAAFFIDLLDLTSTLVSLILGLILPSIFIALPAPSVLSFNQKQIAMTIWQLFPIWVELLQQTTDFLLRRFASSGRSGKFIVTPSKPGWMGQLRLVYVFLLFIAGSTHIATLTLSATSKFFPGLFARDFVGIFNPSRVFLPTTLSSATKMPSIISGSHLMIQFDEILGTLAVSLWAVFMFARVMTQKKKFETPYVFVFDFVSLMALVGPIGYAVICIWARDELIFEDQQEPPSTGIEKKALMKHSRGGEDERIFEKTQAHQTPADGSAGHN